MRFALALLGLPITVGAQGLTDTVARAIDLPTAVSQAQKNAVTTVQARNAVLSAQAGLTQAHASFLPSLTVGASNSHSYSSNYSSHSAGYGLSAGVQLYDGGRRAAEVARSQANLTAGEAAETSANFDIALLVKQQYFNVLAAREAEAAAGAQVKEAEEQVNSANRRLRAGAATTSDSLRSVVALGNAQLALLTAQNSLQIANATLTRLVGSNDLVTANPADTLDQQVPIPDSAELARAIDHAPSVIEADMQLSASKVGVRAAQAPYYPTLSLSFGQTGEGRISSGFGSESFQTNRSWSLNVSLPLFDNLSRKTAVTRAKISEDNSNAAAHDARLLVRQTVTQSVAQMRIAAKQITIQLASVDAAREDVRVQRLRYDVSASTILDVLTSETQLFEARAALIRARYDYRIARAQLEAAIGRDLETKTEK